VSLPLNSSDPGDIQEVFEAREKAKLEGDNRTLSKIWEQELDELGSTRPTIGEMQAERDARERKDREFRDAVAGRVSELLRTQGFRRVKIDSVSEGDGDEWREIKYEVQAFDLERRRYDLEMYPAKRGGLSLTYDRDCLIDVASGIAAELLAARNDYLRRMGQAVAATVLA
jgi:hypothetical protein